MRRTRPRFRTALVSLALIWAVALPSSACGADGLLSDIRDDVRSSGEGKPASEPEPAPSDEGPQRHKHHYEVEADDGQGGLFLLGLAAAGVASPFWGPAAILGDDYQIEGYFGDFPYDGRGEGYMVFTPLCCDCAESATEGGEVVHKPYCLWRRGSSKTFAGRLSVEWAEQPPDLGRVGARLQLNTASRFGLDTQIDWLREDSTGPQWDDLWLGDCNLVFRFAQSQRAQFYSGVGFNWLDDPIDTDYGFNFTYGADFFPARPFVISSSIDWGTLGHSELFRFRATGGLMINRVELFTGYEYLDIDRTQANTYVVGIGVWF